MEEEDDSIIGDDGSIIGDDGSIFDDDSIFEEEEEEEEETVKNVRILGQERDEDVREERRKEWKGSKQEEARDLRIQSGWTMGRFSMPERTLSNFEAARLVQMIWVAFRGEY